MNGSQWGVILIEHYDDLAQAVHDKLNLRKTLIPKCFRPIDMLE